MISGNRRGWFAAPILAPVISISLLIFGRKKNDDIHELESLEDCLQCDLDLEENGCDESSPDDGDGPDSPPRCLNCDQPLVFALRERRWICDSCEGQGSEEVGMYTKYGSEVGTEEDDECLDDSEDFESQEIVQFCFMSAEGKGKSSVLTSMKTWDLIFTDRRLICARLVDSGSAVSWFGVIGYGVSKLLEKGKREELAQRNLDHILGSDKKNFEIPYEMVSRVELKTGIFNGKFRIIDNFGNAFKFLIKNKDYDMGTTNLSLIFGERFVQN